VASSRFAFGARGWGHAVAGLEHGIDELQDSALISARKFLDAGEFPYLRSGQDAHTWQGTVLVDKPDATGTYYRRNRSYDPNTARFTQEDPLGLAGGLNVYGFAGGDPVSYADPFGLSAEENAASGVDCRVVKCPSTLKVITNPEVQKRAQEMYRETLKDGHERGAVLYNGPKGTIVVGPTIVGTGYDANGTASVPGLRDLPENAIGAIHTHPAPKNGRVIGPSGPDSVHAANNHAMSVVRDKGGIYILTTTGKAAWMLPMKP